jgi:hypothetical protein
MSRFPIFECVESGFVLTKEIGTTRRRKILQRSSVMETLMCQEAGKVIDDHKAATRVYDGIICIMRRSIARTITVTKV